MKMPCKQFTDQLAQWAYEVSLIAFLGWTFSLDESVAQKVCMTGVSNKKIK